MPKKINSIFAGLPEDKTSTAIKPKTKRRVTKKDDIKLTQIQQIETEFKEISFVSDTTYKLNYIGIRRILIRIGKYIPKLNIWVQYSDWWNKSFNSKDSHVLAHNELDVNTKVEIFESDK